MARRHFRVSYSFNVDLMALDLARLGWLTTDLARQAGVAPNTVRRFLRKEHQTARVAAKMATALGHSIDRYLVTKTVTPSKMAAGR